MLFMCHQMAMKKEAEDKQKAERLRRAQSVVNVPVIWVLGGPGCGKGTQCEKIVLKYQFTHLSTGDLLRAEVSSGSHKGRELAAIMEQGKLVPNEDVLCLLEKAILEKMGDSTGFLIDGYPREKDQGLAFERKVGSPDIILYFECSDETMLKRIMGRAAASKVKRADDNEATVKARLQTFRDNTNEILIQYSKKIVAINAERDPDVIFHEVRCAIDCILSKKQDELREACCKK